MLNCLIVRVRRLLERLLWALLVKHEYEGIQLLIDRDDEEASLKSVTDNLAMIKTFDSRSFELIQNYLDCIVVTQNETHARAWYLPDKRACCLRLDYVQRYYADDLALSIVHELTHARLFRLGFGYEEAIRFRVEKICIRRELAFASKLERCGSAFFDHVGTIREQLETLSPESYTDQGFKAKVRRDELLGLRYLKTAKCPRCLRRYLIHKVRRRRQKSR